jgi:uncharacterized protein (DUF736 family)
MTQIGRFTRLKGLFSGRIQTLTLNAQLVLVPVRSETPLSPDYIVKLTDSGGLDIGAGWKKSGERAGDYIALVLDDPSLVTPIRANLFRQDSDHRAWILNWNRQGRRDEIA